MMVLKRLFRIYLIIGRTFNIWYSTLFTALLILLLRSIVGLGRVIDHFFFWSIRKPLNQPIIIVGNPRSGTTFLHRFLIKQKLGTGSELWQMLYPSITIQKFIRPMLPFLEKISPARHHSTEAHKTSLNSIETDDVSLLFRYLDGFFLYGFFLTFDKNNLFEWVDPKIRDTSLRDFRWFKTMWSRNIISNKSDRYIGKLFSVSANLPAFQKEFPDSKILYMIRDPLKVIPSGLSLVTGVLDKRFKFWSLKKNVRDRFIQRLYNALLELLNRFHEDWTKGNIDKNKVLIVSYDLMMNDFESLMDNIINFTSIKDSKDLRAEIKKTAKNQRNFKSEHNYDLEKFGLTEEKIKKDCKNIYLTFLT